MAVIKRISPGSAFKVGLVVYAFLGLLIGIVVALISMLAGSIIPSGNGIVGPAAFGMGFGLASIIIFPILYGIIGAVIASIVALLYNLAAGWVGGLEVDLQ